MSTTHILKYWVMMHSTWCYLFCTKILIVSDHHKCLPWHKVHKKDDVGIVAFDLIGLLPTNHIIAYNIKNGIYQSLLGNVRIKFHCWKVDSTRNGKLWKISDSNLVTGRAESTAIVEQWKEKVLLILISITSRFVKNTHLQNKALSLQECCSKSLVCGWNPMVTNQIGIFEQSFYRLKNYFDGGIPEKGVLRITCYAWCLLTVNHQEVSEINW